MSEKHDFAVLHGARRDRNFNGAGMRVMQRDMAGERSAGLHQQDFSSAVPAAAVSLTGMDGRCVSAANIRLRKTAGKKDGDGQDEQSCDRRRKRDAFHGDSLKW